MNNRIRNRVELFLKILSTFILNFSPCSSFHFNICTVTAAQPGEYFDVFISSKFSVKNLLVFLCHSGSVSNQIHICRRLIQCFSSDSLLHLSLITSYLCVSDCCCFSATGYNSQDRIMQRNGMYLPTNCPF